MTKQSILTALLLSAACAVSAQTVSFRNTDAFVTPGDRLIRDWVFGPLVGTQFAAQLYYGASESSLTAVTSNPARFRDPATVLPGFEGTWVGATRTLTGFNPGQIVTLQVRAWDSTGGATFQTAQFRGVSQTFTYQIPQPGELPAAFYMENFRGFTSTFFVPEPSGIGLLAIGATALAVLLRRNRRVA